MDEQPLAGDSYYRLSQTDFDGKSETLDIRAVKCENFSEFSVYPNPFNNEIYIEFNTHIDESVSVRIVDGVGRQVYSESIANPRGRIRLSQAKDFPPGIYFLNVVAGDQSITEKLVKSK